MANIICGVDVSSQALDVQVRPGQAHKRFENSPDGIAALAAFCREHKVELVVMEATGGYEKQPFLRLWAEAVPAALVNPRSVRRFAEAMGALEKTDRIDAVMIAWYAEVKRVVAQQPASKTQEHLRALVTRLRQLTELHTAQINQMRLVTDEIVRHNGGDLLRLIKSQIRSLETKIAELIDTDPLWHKLNAAFRSIKGVADRTVARLMAEMPEIGTLSNKAVAKLAGLAPIAKDSGKSTGKRQVRGGRADVRSILFVVAEIVRRHDPDFAECHKRLSEAGKPKMVIRTALARKLLVRLNAKARDTRKNFIVAT